MSVASSPQLDRNLTASQLQTDEVYADDKIPTSPGATSSAWVHRHQPASSNRVEGIFEKQIFEPKRPPGELEYVNKRISRIHSRFEHDRNHISFPEIDTPFVDELDAIKRLLPYHTFQQPKEDLEGVILCKGKEKASSSDWVEVEFTQIALECIKRQQAIQNRWRKLGKRSGQRLASDDQAYYLAQVILDADKSENAWLTSELRNARTEAERLEREKRASSSVVRMSHFSVAPQGVVPALQSHYYRGYPYSYTQAYGNSASAPTISTFSVSPTTQASTNYVPYQSNGAIPVQLPVASLPALHALGIIPIPVAGLPPEGQPQPPAVLRGSTANGTILSLEINVSLLQNSQMSGLAMILNSLMNRGSAMGIGTDGSSASAQSPVTSNHVDIP